MERKGRRTPRKRSVLFSAVGRSEAVRSMGLLIVRGVLFGCDVSLFERVHVCGVVLADRKDVGIVLSTAVIRGACYGAVTQHVGR